MSSKFTLKPDDLYSVFDPKNLSQLNNLGGVSGIAEKLHTNLETGLSTSNSTDTTITLEQSTPIKKPPSTGTEPYFQDRRAVYGDNAIPPAKSFTFLEFCWEVLKDKILILLMAAAVVEIAIGIWKAVSTGETIAIIDGVAILVAVAIVVLVSALNDYRKQSQFQNLSDVSKSMTQTKVLRDGNTCQIHNSHVMVGDVVLVETGDVLCADGLFISGYNIKCDESSLTGESDTLSKNETADPFLISGTKVVNGMGKMLVVGTGVNSYTGRLMNHLNVEIEVTPLQKKLEALANQIAKFGFSSALCMVVILLVTYFAVKPDRQQDKIVIDLVEVIISAITLIVVAVPEGLPLAVTLALAHATNRMLKDNNLVRHLSACETMGNATTICSDKTGTLTQNRMTVVRGSVLETEFNYEDIPSNLLTNLTKSNSFHKKALINLVATSININCSAVETENQKGDLEFTGSKTEIALLEWTRKLEFDYNHTRKNVNVAEIIPFSSDRKKMSTIIKHTLDSTMNKDLLLPSSTPNPAHFLVCKGASEIVLKACDKYINEQGKTVPLDKSIREMLTKKINVYAGDALRTIGVAFKPLPTTYTPPTNENSESCVDDDSELIFMGIFGIKDPVRDEVPNAVKQCQMAGVVVRMVTGDNLITAKSIATQCGILHDDGVVMEGPAFRRLSPQHMDSIVGKLQVLARSSPLDKQILVNCLKRIGETVAVTGDGTNDAPALRSADVGFSMGIAGTEVAKEASDIVLLDDNFASLVRAVIWGRSVYDSVRKFLQFQLTVNVSAVVITVITSLISTVDSPNKVPMSALTAIQLLWVNLIMDTLAALALATDPPSPSLLERKPAKKSDSLINQPMWRQIIGQAMYQIMVCFIVYLKPALLFGQAEVDFYEAHVDPDSGVSLFANTALFNVFVMCQLFNEINSRSISRELNIFMDIHRNNTFMLVFLTTIVCQVLIIEFGGLVFKTVSGGLSWHVWLICIALGMGSLPVGFLIRLLPLTTPKEITPEEVQFEINEVQMEVEDLVNAVLDTVQVSESMTHRQRQRWKKAIRTTALQLAAVGAFRDVSREAFIEGVRVGTQVAMMTGQNDDEIPDDLLNGLPLEKTPSRGKELWLKAATTVRAEVSVVDAFRRYRRPRSLAGSGRSSDRLFK